VERFGKSTISLSYLCEEVAKLVEEIRPDYVVTEDVYLNPRLPTAFASLLCWICAVKMMLYNKFQLMLYRIPTKVAKQAIFGAGDASKENVMEAVRNRSDIIFKQPKQALNLTEHEADAIAVGVAMASNLQSL
jgi:Holliday junction resolvasome RuvABC endonuclease subunit